MRSLVLLLALGHGESLKVESEAQNRVNPIRKVVTMLQMMQNKVTAEGKKSGSNL